MEGLTKVTMTLWTWGEAVLCSLNDCWKLDSVHLPLTTVDRREKNTLSCELLMVSHSMLIVGSQLA